MKAPTLLFIVGPTAVGKSEIGLQVGQKLNGEIISCDALQVYREITVASDKPSLQARIGVPHYLIDIISITEDFNAARFRQLAITAINEVQARGKTPVIVGGSGMYMSVLLDGIFETGAVAEEQREKLAKEILAQGPAALHERLKGLDPQAAAKIHPNDPQRILRALEVVSSTGKPISQLQQEREGLWGKMPIKLFALNRPRPELYQRVEARVETMFAKGLVDEIKGISELPLSSTAQKLIGIPEVTGYLKGEHDLERTKYLMKLHTRHYVKRQMTWFKREKRLTWIDITPTQSAAEIADIIVKAM